MNDTDSPEVPVDETPGAATATADASDGGAAPAGPAPEGTPTAVRRPPWRRPAVVVLVVICVLALVAAGVFGVLLAGENGRDEARNEALTAGNAAAVVLLSYDHTTLDSDMDRRLDLLTSDYRSRYRSMVADRVAPAARAQKVVTESSVVASSVVDVPTDDRVVLLLFVNQSSRTPALPQPLLTGSRVQMTLDEVDGRWLVSALQPL